MHAKQPTPPSVEYRPVVGFRGYRIGPVGPAGSVESHYRPRGHGQYAESWRPLMLRPNADGYWIVSLQTEPGRKSVRRFVHRLLLEAFVGPCPPGMQACHRNGDPADNRLDNLRWGTPASNMADQKIHGTALLGSRNHKAKLIEDEVRAIRRLSGLGHTKADIAGRFGVSRQIISRIIDSQTWRHIS